MVKNVVGEDLLLTAAVYGEDQQPFINFHLAKQKGGCSHFLTQPVVVQSWFPDQRPTGLIPRKSCRGHSAQKIGTLAKHLDSLI